MKDIRIEPIAQGRTLLVDVTCDCGQNGLTDKATGKASFKHPINVGVIQYKILVCCCGKKYHLHSQGMHIHVFSV